MPLLGSFGAAGAKGFGFTGGGPVPYPIATGGSISETGNYRIHTFTGDGTFVIEELGVDDNSFQMDYLVVAGGGGGFTYDGNNGGYGGGAGGYREANATYTPSSPLANPTGQVTLSAAGSFAVTVGFSIFLFFMSAKYFCAFCSISAIGKLEISATFIIFEE